MKLISNMATDYSLMVREARGASYFESRGANFRSRGPGAEFMPPGAQY